MKLRQGISGCYRNEVGEGAGFGFPDLLAVNGSFLRLLGDALFGSGYLCGYCEMVCNLE